MTDNLTQLIQFRSELYGLLPKRRDAIMNLLDAISSYAYRCKSVIELSTAPCFDRQYSSITDAIADGLPSLDWNVITQLVLKFSLSETTKKNAPKKYILDCTPNPRPFARKLKDRSIVHSPNPSPGNKPISAGHQYCALMQVPESSDATQKHWLVPLCVDRVSSEQKSNEQGMKQLVTYLKEFHSDEELSISIGDSLYGTENCRMAAAKHGNLVHIFRLNSKRHVFAMPNKNDTITHSAGRKRVFGEKFVLTEPSTHSPGDEEVTLSLTNSRGESHRVLIKAWDNMLIRGSRKFRSDQHPIKIVRVQEFNQNDQAVFKRPLWIAVMGNRRNEISIQDVFYHYRGRYDIEHFFRFNKQKLLIDAYQTPDVEHEEAWWRLCALGYFQLYLSKSLTSATPQPWERYLPEYKNPTSTSLTSPSQTQKGFANLLSQIGTPASKPLARGKASGRIIGDTQAKRENHPILFKSKKDKKNTNETIISTSDFGNKKSNAEKIEIIAKQVKRELKKWHISIGDFAKLLNNST